MSDPSLNLDIDPEEAEEIGHKIAEMIERVRRADKILPGSQVRWVIEVDDQRYDVIVTVAKPA